MTDAFQAYINMVTGVTKTTQAKAAATARAMVKQAGLEDVATEASERVTKLAEEIMNANRQIRRDNARRNVRRSKRSWTRSRPENR